MNKLETKNTIFDSIRHIDENNREYWYARELMPLLEYTKWQNFHKVIKQAMIACENSDINIDYHFTDVSKTINMPKGARKNIIDYKLSRYACYLIAQNGDSKKKIIALAQTYFAIQTRKQELRELDYNSLNEDEKRFYQRNLTKKGNYALNIAARNAGVKNFDIFHNYGYKGLYNGETADDIAKRKGLRYREEILDNMGSEELADNLFRIVQTEAKLKNDNIEGESSANIVHYKMGKDIRDFIAYHEGTLPENLPTPSKSLKELEKEQRIRLDITDIDD
jgi:DNA-damage-inducible protein D